MSFYRPELDSLRFLAFLMVFLRHGLNTEIAFIDSLALAGTFGVCLFFLLSSYLITELLEREESVTGTIHLRAFYVRRVLRIWPLYFAALLFDFVLQHFMSPGIFTSSRLIAFLLLAGNWYVSHHGYISTLSTPLWSISVEEQFYVVWPSIRKYFGRRTSIAFSIVMLVVSFLALGIAIDTWTNSFVQFQFFSTGALLALALRGRIPHISPAIRLLLFAAGMLALLNCTQYFPHVTRGFSSSSFPWSALIYLSINVGCILLFLSFLGEPRLGASRLLVYLGRISYGLYVFHWICLRVAVRALRHFTHGYLPKPLTNLFEILLALCLTIACAAASYRFFEAPILRYKNRFEFVRTRV